MIYRKSSIKDVEEIYTLICDMENKQLPYQKFYEIYNHQLNNKNYYCLVCEHIGKVIGILNLRFEEQLHHTERIAEIMELSVLSDFRNKGIGKEILSKGFEISRENGCSQIEVACNQLRKNTHRFYIREGMHNFHFKFSKQLIGEDTSVNILGR